MEGELKKIATYAKDHMTDDETAQQEVVETLIQVHKYQQNYMAQIEKKKE